MDMGVHEMRFLVTAGEAGRVRSRVSALADWLSAPLFALAHLPFGQFRFGGSAGKGEHGQGAGGTQAGAEEPADEGATSVLALSPENIRLAACKQSWDGQALVVRLHETCGLETPAELTIFRPLRVIGLRFKPFEIKTLRIERTGAWREAGFISET
jgi:hypothetical protein